MDFLGNLCVCDGWAISSTQSETYHCMYERAYGYLINIYNIVADLILNKLVYQHREVWNHAVTNYSVAYKC
jgi:hypothetical protein